MNLLESIGVTFLAVLCFGIFFGILWIVDDYFVIRKKVKDLSSIWNILWRIEKELKEKK